MKLFLISQTENKDYDTYDSAVVCCETEAEARNMHPQLGDNMDWSDNLWTWCSSPEKVTVKYLGEATIDIPRGSVCGSFNAG